MSEILSLRNNFMFPQFVSEMGYNQGEDAWNKAKLRICFVFPSHPGVRVISHTQYVLYNIVKDAFGDEVFVDISFMPFTNQAKSFYKKYTDCIYGSFSRHPWQDFDVLGLSIAIMTLEFAQTFQLLHAAHFPVYWKDRQQGDYPLLLLGGISLDNSCALDNVVDFNMWGAGERMLPSVLRRCLQALDTFHTVRSPEARAWLVESCCKTATLVPGCYNPRAYRYDWKVENGVVGMKYLGADEGYPVTVYPDVELPAEALAVRDVQRRWPYPGNHRKSSISSSWGCSGSLGCCNFSVTGDTRIHVQGLGMVPISHQVKASPVKLQGSGLYSCQSVDRQPDDRYNEVTLSNGLVLKCHPQHKWKVVSATRNASGNNFYELSEKTTQELRPGQSKVLVRLGSDAVFCTSLSEPDIRHLSLLYEGYLNSTRLDGKGTLGVDSVSDWDRLLSRAGIPFSVKKGKTEAYRLVYDLSKSLLFTQDFGELRSFIFPWFLFGESQPKVRVFLRQFMVGSGWRIKPPVEAHFDPVSFPAIKATSRDKELWLQLCLYAGYKAVIADNGFFTRYVVVTNPDFSMGLAYNRTVAPDQVRLSLMLTIVNGYEPLLPGVFHDYENLYLGDGGSGKREKWAVCTVTDVSALSWEKVPLYDVVETPDHLCLYGSILTSNCHEANLYTAWRERSPENLFAGLEKAKESSMEECFCYESFNHNFISNFPQTLIKAYDYFDTVSSINFRVDALAASIRAGGQYNYLRLLKELGTISVACAVEGFGERIRNCPVAGTKVLTPDGEKVVENLKPGDTVWSGAKWVRVTGVFKNDPQPIYRLCLKSGHNLVASDKHPVLVNNWNFQNFKALEDVNESDMVCLANSPDDPYRLFPTSTVVSCHKVGKECTYAIEVEGHVYTTDGIVSHNCVLNKNLPFEDWKTVVREAFNLRFLRVKNGFILTGLETKEDWQDAFHEIKECSDLRDETGANSMYVINVTKLVHTAGTPLYHKPRVTSVLNWKETYDPSFYYSPYRPIHELGIKIKAASGRGDTFVQQLHCDLPPQLAEDILLKPALEAPVMSTEYLLRVKENFEKAGLVPEKQFLEYDHWHSYHQHQHISYTEDFVKKEGDHFFEHGHQMCLRTPATALNNNMHSCYACKACLTVDKVRKEYTDLPKEEPHIKWMQTRQIQTEYNISDVKAAQVLNAPSFWIDAVFEVTEKGRWVAKEGLIRFWLVQANKKDPSLVKNFRRIGWMGSKRLDYSKLVSFHYGYEEALLAFKDDVGAGFDEAVKYANEHCEGIRLVKWLRVQTAGVPNTMYLFKLELDASTDEWGQVLKCLESPYKLFEEMVAKPELIACEKWFKLMPGKLGGYSLLILTKPLANPFYNVTDLWAYNKSLSKLKYMKVISLLTPVSGEVYYDLVRDKQVTLSGFTYVPASEGTVIEEALGQSEAPDSSGA